MKKSRFQIIVALISTAIITFIVYTVVTKDNDRVDNEMMISHRRGQEPHYLRNRNEKPFLYASWFKMGNVRNGEQVAIYESGERWHDQYLGYAIHGGNLPALYPKDFQSLQQITTLPPGISEWSASDRKYLLILTLHHGADWTTRYYDRRRPPSEVAKILTLLSFRST